MVLSLLPLLYWRDIVLEAELKMQMYNMLDLSFIRQSDKTNTISSFLVFYAIVQWIFVNLINSGKCCLWDCWKDFEIWLIDWFLQKFSFECEPGREGEKGGGREEGEGGKGRNRESEGEVEQSGERGLSIP